MGRETRLHAFFCKKTEKMQNLRRPRAARAAAAAGRTAATDLSFSAGKRPDCHGCSGGPLPEAAESGKIQTFFGPGKFGQSLFFSCACVYKREKM
ncbi:MAG: hypothetical protein J1E43_03005 [Christensenellaceae bacterium]|nr:hypothetical protein [Christensenellaceae bacterium]